MKEQTSPTQKFYEEFNPNTETPTTVRALIVFAWLILLAGLLLAVVSFFFGINASRNLQEGEEIYKSFIVWRYMLFSLLAAFFSPFLFYAVRGFAIMVKSIHQIANSRRYGGRNLQRGGRGAPFKK
ncbi:MAG: hypothetical protein IKS15_03155 [Opitutales bacterium]|nr:hypothetical protein [Opitutales bacterium]